METLGYATDAAGANNEQFNKTLDSLESKLNELSNAWTEFTTGIANQTAIKWVVDALTWVVGGLNDLTDLLGGGVLTSISRLILVFGALRIAGVALSVMFSNMLAPALGSTAASMTLVQAATNANLFGGLKIAALGFIKILQPLITALHSAASAHKNLTLASKLDAAATDLDTKAKALNISITQKWLAIVGIVILAIIAIYKIIDNNTLTVEEAQEAQKEWNEEMANTRDEVEKTAKALDDLEKYMDNDGNVIIVSESSLSNTKKVSKQLNQLIAGVSNLNENVSLTDDEFQSYQDTLQALVDLGYADSVEEANKKLKEVKASGQDAATAIKEYTEELREQMILEAQLKKVQYDSKILKDGSTAKEVDSVALYGYASTIQNEKNLQANMVTDVKNLSTYYDGISSTFSSLDDTTREKANQLLETIKDLSYDATNKEVRDAIKKLYRITESANITPTSLENAYSAVDLYEDKAVEIKAAEQEFENQLEITISNWGTMLVDANEDWLAAGFDGDMAEEYIHNYMQAIVDAYNQEHPDAQVDIAGYIDLKGGTEEIYDQLEEVFSVLGEKINTAEGRALAKILEGGVEGFETYRDYYDALEQAIKDLMNVLDSDTADELGKVLGWTKGTDGKWTSTTTKSTAQMVDDMTSGATRGWQTTNGNSINVYDLNRTGMSQNAAAISEAINTAYQNSMGTTNNTTEAIGVEAFNNNLDTLLGLLDPSIAKQISDNTLSLEPYIDQIAEIIGQYYDTERGTYDWSKIANSMNEMLSANSGQTGLSQDAQIVYENIKKVNDELVEAKRIADYDDEALRTLATDYVDFAEKVDAVNECLEENEDVLNDNKKGSIKYNHALEDVADSIEDAFGVDVSRDWVETNKDLIDGMDESEEGFNNFCEALVNSDDELKKYIQAIDEVDDTVVNASSLIQGLGDSGAFDVNGCIDLDPNPFIAAIQQAFNSGTISAEAFMELMRSLGYEAEIEYTGEFDRDGKAIIKRITYHRISGAGTSSYGGGSGSGGGGGGNNSQENDATYSQDPFYNYIKTVDQYTNALEELQRQQELLLDPTEIKNNLDAQELEYQRLIGANASYLAEVERQMAAFQQDAMNQYSQYISFAEDGSIRLSQEYFSLTGDAVETIDEWIDDYDDLLSKQTDLNEELDDYYAELKELWEDWRDNYIDIVNEIAEILQEQDEKMLEEKEDFYDKLEQQSEDYLDAVQKNIEKERNLRDKANNYEDLAKKQKRLALLQRDTSGRYDSEIQSLQEEIADAQQDMADEQVDDLLEQLQDQMDEDQRRHEETIELMEKQIDEYVETRAYILEAEEIVAQGDEAIIEHLMLGEEYLEASDAERQQMLDEWGPQIAGLGKYVENVQNGITTAQQYIASQINTELTRDTASVVQAVGSMASQLSGAMAQAYASGLAAGQQSSSTGCGTSKIYASCANCKANCSSSCSTTMAIYGYSSGACSACMNTAMSKYATGGIVDYTGPAWVDGTKSQPEAFLNPTQTSLIGSFAQNLERLSGSSNNLLSGIGDCNIEISIGSLGADYDIDQAIAKVKDEIVRSTEYRNINIFRRSR